MPPLAVTPSGSYLTKGTLSQYQDIDPGQVSITAAQVRKGVFAMLAVAVAVNVISLVIFLQLKRRCIKWLQRCLEGATAASSHFWRCIERNLRFQFPRQEASRA